MGDVLYADAYLAPVAYNRRKFADIRIRNRITSLDPHQLFTVPMRRSRLGPSCEGFDKGGGGYHKEVKYQRRPLKT